FPRLILPLSIVISNLMSLGIQYMLFIAVMLFLLITTDQLLPNIFILFTPVIFLILALFGLGTGVILSSLSAKYRDLRFAVEFGIQLLMYTTTVAYPLSMMEGNSRLLLLINPITPLIETFRYGYLGAGVVEWTHLAYSLGASLVLIFVGMLIFNRIEKTFVDTV
ncbi:MAG: ABC transporter permease, partial [Salibacteraceae bacterium]